jgi:hypothetical protein
MEVLLRMNPGLEMWFGEPDLTDWEEWDEDDEDWPEEGWSFSFLVGWYLRSDFLVAIAWDDFLVMNF